MPFSRECSWPKDRTAFSHSPALQVDSLPLGHQGWRRQWQPTLVLLPGNSRGRRSLVGCRPCGHYQSDTAEQLHFRFPFMHWRRQWQPTPVFLPREAQGSHRVGSHRVGHDGSDLAEQSHQGSTVAPSVTAVLVFSMCYSFVGFHMLWAWCFISLVTIVCLSVLLTSL